MDLGRTAALLLALALCAGCSAERAGAESTSRTAPERSKTPIPPRGAQPAAAVRVSEPAAAAATASAATAPSPEAAVAPAPTPPPAQPDPRAPRREWHDVRTPLAGTARSIGGYSAGCIAGAQELAREGTGYLVMRPKRHRHFGHPDLVDFIRALGAAVAEAGLGGIVIGDLGQPRGGPAPDGHSSHQSGLDADIWYPHEQTKQGIPKRPAARKALKPLPVANFPAQRVTEHWSPRVARVLQLAVGDKRVNRIFVNPMIKRALCESEQERGWLRKLRPWWGHDAHFHVRLSCPAGSPECVPQSALPAGDGCDQVDWWFDKQAQAERDKERAKYRARVGPGDVLPPACHDVLAAAD